MIKEKMNKRAISVALSICLCFSLIVPVSGTVEYGEVVNFTSIRFYGIESNTHNLNGTYTVIDSNEFLALVTSCMALNDNFRVYTESEPYSVFTARFNDSTSQDFAVVTFRTGTYYFSDSFLEHYVSGNTYLVNGVDLDPGTLDYFTLTTTNCLFDDSLTVSNVGYSGQTYLVAKNDADRVLCFDIGTNPVMSSILSRLTQIRTNVATITEKITSIETKTNAIHSLMSSIYSGINNLHSDLNDVNSKLTSINSSLSSISTLCTSILSGVDSIDDAITLYFPVFHNDLSDIDSDLNTFRTNFSNYAVTMISQAQTANSTLSNIDDQLEDINDLLNGTALQGVTVQGSYYPNLWSLIKSTVTTSLSGFGLFFTLLQGFVNNFSGPASQAFSVIDTIDLYSPVDYDPVNISSPLFVFPGRIASSGDTTIQTWAGSNNILVSNTSVSNGTYQYAISSIYLDPGVYTLICTLPSDKANVILISYTDNSQNYGTFTVSERTRYNISCRASRTSIYNVSGSASLVRSG